MTVKVIIHTYTPEKHLSSKEHKLTRMPSVGEYVMIDEVDWFRVEIVTHWTSSKPESELEDNSRNLNGEVFALKVEYLQVIKEESHLNK